MSFDYQKGEVFMHDELLSIGAIKECMEDLGLSLSEKPSYEIDAQMFNYKNHASGNITVKFNSNWQSGDGPYIEVDDVIKGYGINFESFKPQWQEFTYDKAEKKLIVIGDKYKFVLTFK